MPYPLKHWPLLVISGPSGVGKGRVCAALLETQAPEEPSPKKPEFKLSVSSTSRAPRAGEVDGVHYLFLSEAEFKDRIEAGAFLEWAKYNQNYYGTSKQWVEQQQQAGFAVILEIDVQGALQIKKAHPEAFLVMLLPPSPEELERRLRERGTETEEALQQRLHLAQQELTLQTAFDACITNHVVLSTAQEIRKKYSLIAH